MSGFDEFRDRLQYDDEGHVLWPEDPEERTAFVRGLRDTLVEALARHRSGTPPA